MESLPAPVMDAVYHGLGNATPWNFFEFGTLPLFEKFKRKKLPALVGLVVSVPIAKDRIVSTMPPTKLPMGRLYYPTSLGVRFGYVFELPNFRTVVTNRIVSSFRPDAPADRFTDVKLVFQNEHLNVFFSEDGALLVNLRDKPTFFDPAFLRGGH